MKLLVCIMKIRGFRHDYAGMLVSMQMAIDSGDLQEIDRVYNKVLVKANHKTAFR